MSDFNTVVSPLLSWGQTDVCHHLLPTEPSAPAVWLPLHQSETHTHTQRRGKEIIRNFVNSYRKMTFNYRIFCHKHTHTHYLSSSDPSDRMHRSDTCCSPTARQTRASTNTNHAQHDHSTAHGKQKDEGPKKKSRNWTGKVQECIMGTSMYSGIVQGQPQKPITMVSSRRARKWVEQRCPPTVR